MSAPEEVFPIRNQLHRICVAIRRCKAAEEFRRDVSVTDSNTEMDRTIAEIRVQSAELEFGQQWRNVETVFIALGLDKE